MTKKQLIAALQAATRPTDQKGVKAFVGLVNYYGSFIPRAAERMAPLYELLKKDREWKWGPIEEAAFQDMKQCLVSQPCLAHYDSNLPLVVAADASAVAIGAVLAHRGPDGRDQPIAFASKKLNATEQNYSQIEREG